MRILVIFFCISPLFAADLAGAELTTEENRALAAIQESVRRAGTSFAEGEYGQAGEHIRQAIKAWENISRGASPELLGRLKPSVDRISRAHQMLELEGITLPPFRPPSVGVRTRQRPTDEKTGQGQTSMPTATEPSNSEGVDFARDIAPLLIESCRGCHIEANPVRGELRMDTVDGLMRGGSSGAIVLAGNSADSLLVRKLEGTAGERMPGGGRPPLSDESIDMIAKWIDAGARVRPQDQTQTLSALSQQAWLSSASQNQISEYRERLARKNLSLAFPSAGIAVNHRRSDHFLVLGPTGPATLELVADSAEAKLKEVNKLVTIEPAFGGRATIYVMPRRYDYSEFSRMVEARSIPIGWAGHWKKDQKDAYIVVLATDQDDKQVITDRLTSSLVSLAVASVRADVPRWIANGVGTAWANRSRKRRDRESTRRMQSDLATAAAAMTSAKQFLEGKLTPEQTDQIAAGLGTLLLGPARRNFDHLLRRMQDGDTFEQAFAETFRMSPENFIEMWRRQSP